MHKVRLSEQANTELSDITRYISFELFNEEAAKKLREGIRKAIERLSTFPHAHTVFVVIDELEYRIVSVGNYNVYYYVSETADGEKEVVIERILYNKQEFKLRK